MLDFLLKFPDLLHSAIVFGTVIMFGALDEIITEKSGNLNLGVPGIMYFGGIAGLTSTFMYENVYCVNAGIEPSAALCVIMCLVASFLASALGGLIYSFLTITLRTNQNVTGLTLTILGSGVGNFFGLLPEQMQGSKLYGVELDSITGRIAKQLYPKADITIAGFETTDRKDFYDLAVGNVPFGQYQVDDRAYNKDLDASEIEVRLGATWIDKEYIRQFMFELLEPAFYVRRSIDVNYSDFSAEWNITGKSVVGRSDINANMTYGTERANAYKILEDTLNLRDVRIYDTVSYTHLRAHET